MEMLNIDESIATPSQWLKRRITSIVRPLQTLPDGRWATCAILREDTADTPQSLRFGLTPLTSDGTAPRQLVSFRPLPTRENVSGLIFTRMGQIGMLAKVDPGEYLENSAGPIYLYPITECTLLPDVKDLSMLNSTKNISCESPTLIPA